MRYPCDASLTFPVSNEWNPAGVNEPIPLSLPERHESGQHLLKHFSEKTIGRRAMPAPPLLPLNCSCGLVPFHPSLWKKEKKKKKVGLGCKLRIRGCKDFRFNCLKLVISHLLGDLQKMQGAFHVPSVSRNPRKSQITPYSPWALG